MSAILVFLGSLLSTLYNLILKVSKVKDKKMKVSKKIPVRDILRLDITKNISLLTDDKKNFTIKNFKLDQPRGKPLVVFVCWMNARRKHVYKYAEIWMKKGFDVLSISCNARNLLFPAFGTQVVAADVLKFLDKNKSYYQIVVHGFSLGGYQWGEVLVHMSRDIERYQHVLDKIVGNIWDSVGDIEEIPAAMFPRNIFMAIVLGKYMLFHLDYFGTKHYKTSSQYFHSNIVSTPALIITSKSDPIGNVKTNQLLREGWESKGIKVYSKVFEKSSHVGHFKKYPKEYMDQLNRFLESLNLSK